MPSGTRRGLFGTRACRPWFLALLFWLPSAALPQGPVSANPADATVDFAFCGGVPEYPVIGVNFATFCGPRNQIALGRRGQLMWSFPEVDSQRVRHQGVRKLAEEELAELQMLAEAAQVAAPPLPVAGTVRYDLGISFVGRPIQQADGALVPDGSSAMALIDALRRLTPAAPLLPDCRDAPPEVAFDPTRLPAERHAALATTPRHPARAVPAIASLPPSPPTGSGGLAVSPPRRIHPYTFVNQDGSDVVFPAAGRWKIVFFGYTNCPDVCPMTLHKVMQVLNRLGPQAGGLDVFFISIDSERDKVPEMKAFVRRMDARITGLTGDTETLRSLAGEFGVQIRRYQGGSAFATLQHSSLAYLLDPQGALHRLYPTGAAVEAMAGELARLLPTATGAAPVVATGSARETAVHRH